MYIIFVICIYTYLYSRHEAVVQFSKSNSTNYHYHSSRYIIILNKIVDFKNRILLSTLL